MSFDPKNRTHKAQLYPILKALADLDPRKTPELIMDDAVGYPIPHGKDYASNMRKGDINKTFAALTHQWLMEHHFELAQRTSPEIFLQTPETRWREILDTQATSDGLRFVLPKSDFGIVERDSELQPVDASLKLGQRFLLEVSSDTDGFAVALQGCRDQWYPIKLGVGSLACAPVAQGANVLPRLGNGQLDPLSENCDVGLHDFVVVVGGNDQIPVKISQLVTWVSKTDSAIHRNSVRFFK
ncbi:MAG: hypothetical protein AAF999_13615 [Pseudomonadota bacterium]